MKPEDLPTFFNKHYDEFLEFERIKKKLSNRPDLHAFLLLDKLLPGDVDMVNGAGYEEIYLDVDVEELLKVATKKQLIDLYRCGVRYNEDYEWLCMFV